MGYTERCIFSPMDKLKEFLNSMTVAEREAFAARCGTTYPFLRNIAYGSRTAGEKLSVAIEIKSRRAVTRIDLRPDDWHEIWPELVAKQRRRSAKEPAHA